MNYFGIGNDIIEIKRIEAAISKTTKDAFIRKIYSENEIKLIKSKGNKPETYAGRFAAKEAISKALGTGIRNFKASDIEILNNEFGKPYCIFKNTIKNFNNLYRVDISISHCKEYATAVAIIFKK